MIQRSTPNTLYRNDFRGTGDTGLWGIDRISAATRSPPRGRDFRLLTVTDIPPERNTVFSMALAGADGAP